MRRALVLILALVAAPAAAQGPLSAIDWLSNTVAGPSPGSDQPAPPPSEPAGAPTEDVAVAALGQAQADAVGLYSASSAGLPRDFWSHSETAEVIRLIKAQSPDMPPAVMRLFYKILLAELEPPIDAGAEPDLLIARIDALLALGAVDQAAALMDRAGITHPEVFRRAFDASLLLQTEDDACAKLRAAPDLSPTFAVRVFCLARGGDWEAAALTLGTARALGFISPLEDDLLSRFLDPALYEDDPWLPPPERPTPLEFRMLEAIGEPLPTASLPVAFANADLHANSGWKARIEAAERLARTEAIDANLLLGLYTERKPAASGGVWDRVAAIQHLDGALNSGAAQDVAAALPAAWKAARQVHIEAAFASLFADRLATVPLSGDAAALAFRIGLLGDNYRAVAQAYEPADDEERLLVALAQGRPGDVPAAGEFERAIQDGFRAAEVPERLKPLMADRKIGEAVLTAMQMLTSGARGNLDDLTEALLFMHAAGLEETARRSALELIVLHRSI